MPINSNYTFRWYDTETSGVDPAFDQVYQLASIKTDSNLNIIEGSEVNMLCAPRPDVIPHPKAFLTHRLDIDILKSSGMTEFALSRKLQSMMMAQENTVVCGYNTMRFDDVVARNMMYRNMLNSYDHEWKDGNRRFDVFKLVQMVYAFRPEILSWKKKEDGKTSLKLSDLSEVNGIIHECAHDALSDVLATIGIAKLIKDRNGKAYDYLFELSDKTKAMALLSKREPLLHVSSFYGTEKRNTTMVLPIIMDASNKNKMLCVDLRHDPYDMLSMSANDIKKYLFTKREDLPENSPIIPAVGIAANDLPIIVEAKKMLTNSLADSCQLDMDKCLMHAEEIKKNKDFIRQLQEAFVTEMPKPKDVYSQLYSGGFLSRTDTQIRSALHVKATDTDLDAVRMQIIDVHETAYKTDDKSRQFELMLRAKWGNFHEKIMENNDFSKVEFQKWVNYLENRLYHDDNHNGLTIHKFREILALTRIEKALDYDEEVILNKLENHINELDKNVQSLIELSKNLRMEASHERNSNTIIQKIEKIIDENNSFSDEFDTALSI
jgi:Exonuclease I